MHHSLNILIKSLKNIVKLWFLIIVLLCSVLPVFPGNSASLFAQISWSGYLENYNAFTTTGRNELISGRNQLRLNMLANLPDGRVYASQDIRNNYNFSPDSINYTLREAWIELHLPDSDLRVGRQVIVWGQAEGSFIADLISPVDFSEFLTRSFDDLRSGVDAISYTRYFGSNSLQLVANPVFKSYTLPVPGSRWDIRPPLPDSLNVSFEPSGSNAITLRNMQFAARLSLRPTAGSDLNFALMYWRPGLPAYRKTLLAVDESGFRLPEQLILQERFRPTFIAAAVSVFRLAGSLNALSEIAFYYRRDSDYLPENVSFKRINELLATNPQRLPLEELIRLAGELDSITRSIQADSASGLLRAKPFISGMTGLRYTRSGWLISTQYLAELILDYDQRLLQEQYYHSTTLLMQRTFRRDTMALRTFIRYNFNGGDFWINPEWQYDVSDSISLRLGSHLFGGPLPATGYGHLHFRNFASNSFIYGGIRAFW
jgi:hypothetical protein